MAGGAKEMKDDQGQKEMAGDTLEDMQLQNYNTNILSKSSQICIKPNRMRFPDIKLL